MDCKEVPVHTDTHLIPAAARTASVESTREQFLPVVQMASVESARVQSLPVVQMASVESVKERKITTSFLLHLTMSLVIALTKVPLHARLAA